MEVEERTVLAEAWALVTDLNNVRSAMRSIRDLDRYSDAAEALHFLRILDAELKAEIERLVGPGIVGRLD